MKEIFVSGRTELAGNHTDHQNGRILAAAIDLGITARVEANDAGVMRVRSQGHEPFEVRTNHLTFAWKRTLPSSCSAAWRQPSILSACGSAALTRR